MSENPRPSDVTDGPIHTWFSLSYSNYLVLHRTLLQSMPAEWQERLVALLGELGTAFEHVPQAEAYKVEAATTSEDFPSGEITLLPTADPVPHYNRGRTYIAPKGA